MNILSLSLDTSVLDPHAAGARMRAHASLVRMYTVIVPSSEEAQVRLAPGCVVYGIRSKNKALGFLNVYQKAQALLKDCSYDVISVQDAYFLGVLGVILARRARAGLEIQVHGFEKKTFLRSSIAHYVLSRADSVRAVSLRLQRELISTYGVPKERIIVAPIVTPAPAASQRPYRQLNHPVTFISVGRLVEVKNVSLQLAALATAQKRIPDMRLWIVGDGPLRTDLKREVKEKGLEQSVTFLGWQDDIYRLFKEADIFLLSSDCEGWGRVAVEAAYAHLPIIMTDVGLAGEVIINNHSGMVVPVGDFGALSQAMCVLASDFPKAQSLAAAAYKSVHALSSQQETLARYKESWEQAYRNRKA